MGYLNNFILKNHVSKVNRTLINLLYMETPASNSLFPIIELKKNKNHIVVRAG